MVTALAICDTDGGRHEPRPLLAHVYPLERTAEQRRERLFDTVKQYYPIRCVRIEFDDVPEPLGQALNEGDGVYRP